MADARLAQHVDKGVADGLLISCVSSCSNLWALIMDAGTGFTSQVYELSPFFLHKVYFFVLCNPRPSSDCLFYSPYGRVEYCSSGAIDSLSVPNTTGMDHGAMGKELLH